MRISVVVALLFAGVALAAPPKPPPSSTTQAPTAATGAETAAESGPASDELSDLGSQAYPAPQIDWGKCPQLQPSDADKEQKRVVIQKCLEDNPPPAVETITDPKQIDTHREVVTTCALKKEGWFNDDGSYKFDKAKAEIQSKNLDKEVEKNISKRHEECQAEAAERYPKGYIEQVQLYQACMDYHIAEICEIELIAHPDFPVEMYLDEDVPSEEILRQIIPEEAADAANKEKSEKEASSSNASASTQAKPAADSQT